MTLRIGSLCSGYEGLGTAVMAVLGGELAWVADNDPGAAAILAHRFPSVPNLGDITAVDWSAVEPVDILTAGFPCQDISCAGKRQGLRKGTRSGLWFHVARAISELRPPLVVIENVKELLSERADSDVEQCPWCLGDTNPESAMRALGAVLADLAEIGFDAEWVSLPAAAVGACHLRWRVFILAWPAADTAGIGSGEPADQAHAIPGSRDAWPVLGGGGDGVPADPERDGQPGRAPEGAGETYQCGAGPRATATGRRPNAAADTQGDGRDEGRPEPAGLVGGSDAAKRGDGPAADAEGGQGREWHGDDVRPGWGANGQGPATGRSAPADTAGGGRDGRSPLPEREQARGIAPSGSGGSDHGRVTAADPDSPAGGPDQQGGRPGPLQGAAVAEWSPEQPGRLHSGSGDPGAVAWGAYEQAIRRWEAILGRPAPSPTDPGRTGQRLSPRFVEWMQGLPDGWVTDVPGLSRNAQLKALGNGVVPAQAAAALRLLLARAFGDSEAAA